MPGNDVEPDVVMFRRRTYNLSPERTLDGGTAGMRAPTGTVVALGLVSKRPRVADDRSSLSPSQWREMRDGHSGRLVPVRSMSDGADEDINGVVANLAPAEFRVLSTEDIQNVVQGCGQQVSARCGQMEYQMEQEMHMSRAQVEFFQRQFHAETQWIVEYSRNEYEHVQNEAKEHQRHWHSEVRMHQQQLICSHTYIYI